MMSSGSWQFLIDQVIEGRYHLRELLGTGSYGGVFRADEVVDDRLIRQVAIKLITSSNEVTRDRQFEELSLSCQLDHPNVVRSFSVGRSALQGSELLYIVMELANGSLTDRLSNGPLPDVEAQELATHLTCALLYLHTPPRQLVHRDIKPANILRVGDAWKLSDFGTARVVGSETMVRTGPLGTAPYAPPESYDEEVSRAWDVWSFGVVLAQALSGRLPFAGDTLNQLQRSILHDPPDIPVGLPSPFESLIQGCLVRDRRSRFTIEQVRDVLSGRRPRRSLLQIIRGAASNVLSRFPIARGLLRYRAFAWVTALLLSIAVAVASVTWFHSHSELALTVTPESFPGSGGIVRVFVPQVPIGESSATRMELRDDTGAVLGSRRMSAQNGKTTAELHIPASSKQSPRKLELLITTSVGRQGHFTVNQAGNHGLDEARAIVQEAKSILDEVEERILFYKKNAPPVQDVPRIQRVLRQQCNRACEMGNRALALAPSPKAYLCIIQARRFAGDESTALQIARRALQQFPGDPELQSEIDILTRRRG